MLQLAQKGDAILLHVKVVPNSSRTKIAGVLGDALKIKIAQPPEAGKANQGVIALLADILQLAPAQISISAGHTTARKTIQIVGLTAAQISERLLPAIAGAK